MKWFAAWVLTLLLACTVSGQTNVLVGTAGDYGLAVQSNVTATLTLIYPNPRTSGGVMVRQDPITRVTGASGEFRYTNILWGKYQLSLSGRVATPFTFWVGTNTTGTVSISALVTNAAAIPPNPATNYYTQAQIDALLGGVVGGSGALTNNESRAVVVSNSVTATGGFVGNLGASNLTGTIPDARLTDNVLLRSNLVSSGISVQRYEEVGETGLVFVGEGGDTNLWLPYESGGATRFPNGILLGESKVVSVPQIKVSGTSVKVRLGNDSADAPITASDGTFSGTVSATGGLTGSLGASNLTGTLPTNTFPAVIPSVTVNGEIAAATGDVGDFFFEHAYGDFNDATNLNASALGTGTVPLPRLPGIVVTNESATENAYAIGGNSSASASGAVALGPEAAATGVDSVAIGSQTYATAWDATAIGAGAVAGHASSVALGALAATTTTNQLRLGTANETVSVPGRLTVDGGGTNTLGATVFTGTVTGNGSGLTNMNPSEDFLLGHTPSTHRVIIPDGDSLTSGYLVGMTNAWPVLLSSMLPSGYTVATNDSAWAGKTLVDCLGEYATGVQPEILATVASNAVPIVALRAGINDIAGSTPATVLSNINQYVDYVHADGGKIMLWSITRNSTAATSYDWNEKCDQVNFALRQQTNWDFFVDADFGLPKPGNTNFYVDATHFNSNGQAWSARMASEALRKGRSITAPIPVWGGVERGPIFAKDNDFSIYGGGSVYLSLDLVPPANELAMLKLWKGTSGDRGYVGLSSKSDANYGTLSVGHTGSATTPDFYLLTDSNVRMKVDKATGNVGFGTINPGGRLSVANGTAGGGIGESFQLELVNTNYALGAWIGQIFRWLPNSGYGDQAYIGAIKTSTTDWFASDLVFGTKTNASTTNLVERVRIKGLTGFVGIGTNNPTTMLDVAGSINATTFGGNSLVLNNNATIRGTVTATTANTATPAFKSLGTNNVILKCPDGGSFILRIDDAGTLSTATNSANL